MAQGEVALKSYARLRSPGVFSEELLEKILRGVSTQKYADTILHTANAVGVSPTAMSRKLVDLTATKLKAFQERSLDAFKPFALFLDTIPPCQNPKAIFSPLRSAPRGTRNASPPRLLGAS